MVLESIAIVIVLTLGHAQVDERQKPLPELQVRSAIGKIDDAMIEVYDRYEVKVKEGAISNARESKIIDHSNSCKAGVYVHYKKSNSKREGFTNFVSLLFRINGTRR